MFELMVTHRFAKVSGIQKTTMQIQPFNKSKNNTRRSSARNNNASGGRLFPGFRFLPSLKIFAYARKHVQPLCRIKHQHLSLSESQFFSHSILFTQGYGRICTLLHDDSPRIVLKLSVVSLIFSFFFLLNLYCIRH